MEHSTDDFKRPLAGVKILDLTQFVSGPFCTQILADLGARVIKIEKPGSGDPYRRAGPSFVDGESTLFISLNRGKESIALNLKDELGKKLFLEKFLPNFDVVVENFSPGTMESLGISYNECKRANSDIVYCDISGFGARGPLAQKKGFDLILQAASGIMDLTGEEKSEPVKVGVPITDFVAALFSTVGILAALYENKSRTEGGVRISTSLYESSVSLLSILACDYLASGKAPQRMGSASPIFAPYQAFKAKDAYIAVAGAGSEDMWHRFVDAIEIDGLSSDPRFVMNSDRVKNQTALADIINRRLEEKDADHWLALFDSKGVPCSLVGTLPQVLENDQTRSLELISETPLQNQSSDKKFQSVRLPLSFNLAPVTPIAAPPSMGEHTNKILSEVGLEKNEIANLRKKGIVS